MTDSSAADSGELRDRSSDPWRKELEDLLAGPYAGHGGVKELAIDLGISRRALDHYLSNTATRRDPSRTNRLRIRKLWEDSNMDR